MPVRSGNRINHLHAEAVTAAEGFENLDVPGALAAETMIVADQKLTQTEASAEYDLDKAFGGVGGETRCERKHSEVVDSRLGEDLLFLIMSREQQWSSGEIHHLQRMRLESDEHAWDLQRARASYQTLPHIPVPAVDAIEGADGYHGSAHVRRQARFVSEIGVPRHLPQPAGP